jgi:hypothetical protein
VAEIFWFPPQQHGTMGTMDIVERCRCHELTAGPCSYCSKLEPKPVSVELTLKLDPKDVEVILRAELAKLLRVFAEEEAGPVGIRLRQIAGVFEEDA